MGEPSYIVWLWFTTCVSKLFCFSFAVGVLVLLSTEDPQLRLRSGSAQPQTRESDATPISRLQEGNY